MKKYTNKILIAAAILGLVIGIIVLILTIKYNLSLDLWN